jgi:hypothetical protein
VKTLLLTTLVLAATPALADPGAICSAYMPCSPGEACVDAHCVTAATLILERLDKLERVVAEVSHKLDYGVRCRK